MTLFSLRTTRLHAPATGAARADAHSLELEKVGVMAGFLAGLPLGLAGVHDAVLAMGLADWVADGAAAATVVGVTWLGLRCGAALARLAGQR